MVTKKATVTGTKVAKAPAKVVKKVSQKVTSAPKKVAPKVSTTKEKNTLMCAPGEQCFWMSDGKILADLVELRDALASMSDDVFAYHVSKNRNDFADWIENVLQDMELATALRKTKKATTAHQAVVSRLRIYSI